MVREKSPTPRGIRIQKALYHYTLYNHCPSPSNRMSNWPGEAAFGQNIKKFFVVLNLSRHLEDLGPFRGQLLRRLLSDLLPLDQLVQRQRQDLRQVRLRNVRRKKLFQLGAKFWNFDVQLRKSDSKENNNSAFPAQEAVADLPATVNLSIVDTSRMIAIVG